jgi:Protein of unknown function (DUF3987)
MSPLDRVLDALDAVRPSGEGKWLARCPAHEDRSPSLSIAIGDDDRVLVHCFAGCTTEEIVAALGLEVRELFSSDEQSQPAAWRPPSAPRAKQGRHAPMPSEQQIATWRHDLLNNEAVVRRLAELRGWTRDAIETLGLGYDGQRIVFPVTDAAGRVVGIARYLPGDRPNGERKMLADAGSIRELWPAPESLDGTSAVWLTEGEPDGVSLALLGLQASAVPGAASWRSEWAARFAGRDVIVCTDCDENGRALAAQAADDLIPVARSVRIIDLDSERTDAYDVGDLVREAAEHGPDGLVSLKVILEQTAESAERLGLDWPAVGSRTLPAFPVDALPRPVAVWVQAMAEHTQTPVDLPALAALGVLSGAALGGAVVDCGAWEEELGLYLLPAMPSGDRKSTVLRAATQPLRELERERADVAAPRIRELRSRGEVLAIRARNLTKAAARENVEIAERVEAERDLADVGAELDAIGEPAIPRLLADDATPEALGGLLSKHGSIAVLAAESALIDNLAGRYSEGRANLHLVCAAYSGEPTTIDRKGHDPERLDRPLLAIALVVQPHVLEALVAHETARAQGLVARFAYALPETRLGRRQIDAPRVPREATEAWAMIVRRVARNADKTDKTVEQGGSVGSVGTFQPVKIALAPIAHRLLSELQEQIEPRLAPTRDLYGIADWAGRHHGRVARIAGLLHLCEHALSEPIGEPTMRAALQIGDYLLEHGIAVLTGPDEKVRRALRWLERQDADTVTVRDLQRGPLGGRGTAEQAEVLATSLDALGALRALPRAAGRPGRPASPAYSINPHLRRAGNLAVDDRPPAPAPPTLAPDALPAPLSHDDAAHSNGHEATATSEEEALLERASRLIGGEV